MRRLLEFVYSDTWTFPKEEALPLMLLAGRFGAASLVEAAEGVAERQLCHSWRGCCGECRSWVLPTAYVADSLGRAALADAALAMVARAPDQFWTSTDFSDLPQELRDRVVAQARRALTEGDVDALVSTMRRLLLARSKLAAASTPRTAVSATSEAVTELLATG